MYDVIVIGVGTFGAATCAALAARGANVLGLEQFDIPHRRGAHHGHSRIYRLGRYEKPEQIALLRRAGEMWRELGKRGGRTLLHETGVLYAGPGDGPVMRSAIAAAEKFGFEHEVLREGALAERYPQFRLPEGFLGMLEPQGGFVTPEAAVEVLAAGARLWGAEIRSGEKVYSWRSGVDLVEVETDRGVESARRLVVCGGAWSGRIVIDLGVALRVTRQVLGWVNPAKPEAFAPDRFPCWILDTAEGNTYYGFPTHPGSPGLKVARHGGGADANPDTLDRRVTDAEHAEFREPLRRFIPGADGPIAETAVCTYTMSPDEEFIIDRHPRHANVWVACGFSGHGFKFAPAIGEALAESVLTGRTHPNLAIYSLARFGVKQ